ncbi:MAG: hypothetical protein IKZ96_03380 [Bacilli bacterium]|nr:hypothetical protein [Bacilli bacterium]
MSNKKRIIYILIAIVVICIIVGTIIFFLSGKKFEKTIFIGNVTKYTIDGNDITISTDDIKVKKQKVKILYNNKIIDGYIKTEKEDSSGLENSLHMYNKSNKQLSDDPYAFAYTDDLKLTIIGFNTEYIDDISRIVTSLLKNNIDVKTVKLDFGSINSFDIDDDGIIERIYSYGVIYNNNEYFSEVVMEKDGKYYSIVADISNSDDDEKTVVDLFGIIDFNSDGNYEYIISKSYSEFGQNEYELYNFDGSNFNRLYLR